MSGFVTKDAIEILNLGIIKLGLEPAMGKVDNLISYLELLHKWNKYYSLTSITNAKDMVRYHILDALTVINNLGPVKNVLDVGSGMGVPGVVLSIWCPNLTVTVLDSNHKKAAFLQQVAIELNLLPQFTVVNSRIESFYPAVLFDLVISRAFADSKLFVKLAKHTLGSKGFFLAMKSQKIQEEIDELSDFNYSIIPVEIPEIIDQRYLLKIEMK